jgi:hypothetical protein
MAFNLSMDIDRSSDDVYVLTAEKWYQAPPYAFRADLGDSGVFTFYLPLNPNNITINTQFATNVIATMYGTIEEHSEQRYFDISLQGTTGVVPKYNRAVEDETLSKEVRSRGSFSRNKDLTRGFFQRTQALIKLAIQKAMQTASDLLPVEPYIAGMHSIDSGYAAFHNLYRFLLVYKKELMNGNAKGLYFVNYKDNNQYRVAINNFQVIRTAEDPMLYNYSVSMRGYDLLTNNTKLATEVYDYSNRLKDLGLDGVTSPSMFNKMSSTVRNAKSTAYAAVAAVKGFGR